MNLSFCPNSHLGAFAHLSFISVWSKGICSQVFFHFTFTMSKHGVHDLTNLFLMLKPNHVVICEM